MYMFMTLILHVSVHDSTVQTNMTVSVHDSTVQSVCSAK